MQSNVFSINKTLNIRGKLMDLSTSKVMGILNVTPDSFYDGGKFSAIDEALIQCEKILVEGATFIDVGGYSTRPGADDISEEDERARVIPIVKAIVREFPSAIVSIDTFRSSIAKAAVNDGASLINDVSGGDADAKMFQVVAELGVPYVLMHTRGTPKTMTALNQYDNVVKEVVFQLSKKASQLISLGVTDVIVDPGFGFAKNIDQNFELLHHLDHFRILDKPLLVGLSRKSMIWKTLGIKPEEALTGTISLNTLALMKGAAILRVHDVKEAVQCVKLVHKALP